MEIDTGASLSIISEETYNSLWVTGSRPKLQPTTVNLHIYTKESITALGSITIDVCYKASRKHCRSSQVTQSIRTEVGLAGNVDPKDDSG